MKYLLKCLLVSVFFCFSANAYEVNAYAQPIPYGDFVEDMSQLLDEASKANNWMFSKNENGQYFAKILHKGYKMEVEFVVDSDAIKIQLDSAIYKEKSVKSKHKVQGWLLRLRRSVAYQVTLAARNDAGKKRFLKPETI